MFDRSSVQMLIEKLDQNALSLKEGKDFAKRLRIPAGGRTKEQFIRSLSKIAGGTK